MNVQVPQDLFILQIAASPNTSGQRLVDFYAEVEKKLGISVLIQLYFLIRSLIHILESFDCLVGRAELEVSDDGFLYFCEYCLSLPRERLESYLIDPYFELTNNRIYYASPNNQIYEREGYLHYDLRDYIASRYPNFDFELRLNPKEYVQNYVDQLHQLTISPSSDYSED